MATYPVMPLTKNQAISIGMTSYDGRVFVAINADFDSVPDLPDLVDGLGEALEELKQAVKALGGRRGRAAKPAKR
jgi:hypothetical protein